MNGNEAGFSLRLKVPTDLPSSPIGANYFHFTFIGPELEMLVGNLSLRAIHEFKEASEKSATAEPVVPNVTHRFMLTPLGFDQLRQQIEEIGRKFDAMMADKGA